MILNCIIKFINGLSNVLGKIIEALLFIFLLLMLLTCFFQILSRFVFKIPTVWTEEIVRICFVWITFLGAAIAVKEGTYLFIDIISSSLRVKSKKILNILNYLLILLISSIFLISSIEYVGKSIGKLAVTIRIPANIGYISATIFAILSLIFSIENILKLIVNNNENNELVKREN